MCPNILELFHELLSNNDLRLWFSDCMIAFAKFKTALSEPSMLVLCDPSKELALSVYSSYFREGAILYHIVNSEEYPITFESATLSPS